VLIQIPADARQTDNSNPSNAILWRLDAQASVPGVDFSANFEVPVFKTAASGLDAPGEEQQAAKTPAVALQAPSLEGIIVRPTVNGGIEFHFAAGRNTRAAVNMTIFSLVWFGAICLFASFVSSAPLAVKVFSVFFFGLFGVVGVLIGVFALKLWLGISRICIEAGQLTVSNKILGIGLTRTTASSEIAEITLPIGLQAGGGSGTPYYDIRFLCKNGRKITAGTTIKNKHEAEWLVSQMRTAIGISTL
jgi:hypothetical protein